MQEETNFEDESLKALIKKRGSIKQKLTNFEKFIEKIEGMQLESNERATILELERRIETADSLLVTFDDMQIEIECMAENSERQFVERGEFEDRFHAIMAKSRVLFERVNPSSSNDNVASNRSSSRESSHSNYFEGVKLPEIKLPKFDGFFENWMEFRDTFESLIHTNSHINTMQKYHYLRASLTGTAAQVIKSLEFSSSYYNVAWNTLCERYNNNRLLVQNHIKAVFDIEQITVESSGKLRFLSDTLFKHLTSLKQLGEQVDYWATLIIYIMSSKLDNNTAREWEKTKVKFTSCTLDNFRDFLKLRADLLETIEMNFEHTNQKHSRVSVGQNKRQFTRGLHANLGKHDSLPSENKTKYICLYCKQDHNLFYCSSFLKLPIKDRVAKVKSLKLCLNCLRRNHLSKDCKWSGCKVCGGKHNTILHEENTNNALVASQINDQILNVQNDLQLTNCGVVTAQNAILSTAKVMIRDSTGKFITARAVLDCGSQSSFITSDLFKKLKLPKTETNLAISGINGKMSYTSQKCHLKLRSMTNSYSFDLTGFVLDNITNNLPHEPINIRNINIPSHVRLADPEFSISKPIDILIGAEMFWLLLDTGRIDLVRDKLILQKTHLGWIVAGHMPATLNNSLCYLSQNINLQEQLTKFWEVEEVSSKKPLSLEETLCEQHFQDNLKVAADGRYIVSLPLKDSPDKLGDSRATAIKRFLALERKFISNPSLRTSYINFLKEYEELGHMSLVTTNNESEHSGPEYFMPHHGVMKQSSTTTKLRVVFNASCPSSSGISLNNLQMTGPIIQQDLFSIILRFRLHAIVLSSDIKMMYRQVLVNPEDRTLQQIVWRESPNDSIKTYELNTVTYGTTAASFLAIRCLHEVANEFEDRFPKIANIIKNDMYVDDLLTSVDSREEAIFISRKISEILCSRGFELRKWKSNEAEAIIHLNSGEVKATVAFTDNKEQDSKTLGLLWACDRDILTYTVSEIKELKRKNITKRTILSKIASIFDPLGLISPCVIIAKILLQKLWTEKLTWDQPLPDHILTTWLKFSDHLDGLNAVNINRKVICDQPVSISLHGFSDASESSYGACVYVVSTNAMNEHFSNLLCAKSRVAPLKSLSIPRLELCAALILAQLISKVLESINITPDSVYCWSDSTIVLGWLKTSPNLLKTFVDNRVAEIQRMTNAFSWRHVPTRDNPADIVSRGVFPNHLATSELWWHGPLWLLDNEENWPTLEAVSFNELPEKRQISSFVTISNYEFPFERFSNLSRLKRTVAFIFRFCQNAKSQFSKRNFASLTVSEINNSFDRLLIIAQKQSFGADYDLLLSRKELPHNSKILSLNPFIDSCGLLRVGGRLSNSKFSYAKKHPILLSPKHHVTKLIFKYEHEKLLHAAPQLLLAHVREQFWSVSGRNIARNTVLKCVKCCRFKARNIQPIMGDLPIARVQPTLPFSVVGIDYAGPFLVKDKRGRGSKTIKSWVCVFVCFSTRAMHLEMVLSLTTEDFMQSFNRFVGRRGMPSEVFSDNGTTFIKANKDLKEMWEFLEIYSQDILQLTACLGVKWHFIPVNSPHFGGLWEAGVKSFKYHLKRVVGSYVMFLYDFQAVLIRIESVLNSRPLCPLSSSPDDLSSLTPAHFLIGRPLLIVPEASVSNIQENRLSQYQLVQRVHEQFWNRWHKEYVSELQQRTKWKRNSGDLRTGQLVLIKDNSSPPMMWKMGRVVSFTSGKDGVNRVALVKTVDGLVSRAVVRLCPLPIES